MLLNYLHTVKLGASRSTSLTLILYDEQYRFRKAQNPSSSWACVDTELWLVYMSPSSHLNMHTSQQNNLPSTRPNLKCYSFNYSGSCVRYNCNYHHKCLYCSGDHPLIRCSSKPIQNNINQKSFPRFPNTSQRPLLNQPTSFTRRHFRPRVTTSFVGQRTYTN